MIIKYYCDKCKSECRNGYQPSMPPIEYIECPNCGILWQEKEEIKKIYLKKDQNPYIKEVPYPE